MIIAGITGGIGHGKTTLADLLADQSKASRHFESWEMVAEVATALKEESPAHPAPDDIAAINEWLYPLPDIVSFHMHTQVTFDDLKLTDQRLQENPEHFAKLFEYLSAVQVNPTLAQTPLTIDTKELFRPLLQWLGGYLVEKAGGLWYDEMLRRIKRLETAGVELVTVGGVRFPSDAESIRNAQGVILQIKRPDKADRDSGDLTERERNLIVPDSIIVNDGSLDQLATCAKLVYRDLRLRQLQPIYQVLRPAEQPF
ncbi:MAG: hypothetical protein JWN82_560 [Candidatus Saccharibacteria bacterium]|nr:hypothetical protein [Candidatus Saccharibacteria bacterium]